MSFSALPYSLAFIPRLFLLNWAQQGLNLAEEDYQIDEDLGSGRYTGVFIDDTGSPGAREVPEYLHPNRSTWVAVIIQPEHLPEMMLRYRQLFLSGLKFFYGADEFHSTDVFSGTGPFKGVDFERRLNLLWAMAGFLKKYDAQILTENLDPDIVNTIRADVPSLPPRLGPFDLTTAKGMALLSLLNRVSKHLKKHRQTDDSRAYVIVDSGILRHGMAVPSFWPQVFSRDKVFFSDSRGIYILQLADFAAFSLNRIHLSAGRHEIKPADAALLEVFSWISSCYRDLVQLDAELHSKGPGSFQLKGFKPHPNH